MKTAWTTWMAGAAVALVCGSGLWAADGGACGVSASRQAQRQANQAARKAQRQAHGEARKAAFQEFKKTLAGKSGPEIVAATKDFCTSNYEKATANREKRYSERLEKVKARLSEKNVPAEKQEEILKKAAERYDQAVAHHQTQHQENMAVLDGLAGKSDITPEEVQKTLREHRKTQREENKQFRQSRRQGRGRGRNSNAS